MRHGKNPGLQSQEPQPNPLNYVICNSEEIVFLAIEGDNAD